MPKKSLTEIQKTINVGPVDLSIPKIRQEIIDYIYYSETEIFNFCYARGFIEEIIKSKNVRCLVARDQSQMIVGILWGFLNQHEGQSLFHFWELSRKPAMAHMGIAKRLIDCAKQQQALYPQIQFATLNVDVDNLHAKTIYENEQFAPLSNKEKESIKIFMTHNLKNNQKTLQTTTKQVVRNFVVATIPIYKLLYFEVICRCRILFRSVWYR